METLVNQKKLKAEKALEEFGKGTSKKERRWVATLRKIREAQKRLNPNNDFRFKRIEFVLS